MQTLRGAHAPIGLSKHAHSPMTTQRSNNQIILFYSNLLIRLISTLTSPNEMGGY